MGVDPFDTTHTEPDPEKALSLAVIQRAILDHVSPDQQMTLADKRDARLFLFAMDGPWAASRWAWCEVADIDEGWLQRRVRAIIAGEAEIASGKKRWRVHTAQERAS